MKIIERTMIITVLLVSLSFAVFAGGQGEGNGTAEDGELVIYTPNGPEITDPILDEFREQYPDIDIELVNAGTGELLSRLEAERENPAADVLWGGSTVSYDQNSELFASYESPNDEYMRETDPNNKWHAFSILLQPIFVNTDLVDEEDYPTTVQELTDPVWQDRGGMALTDPNTSGTAYTLFGGFSNAFDWEFIAELVENAQITQGSDAMFQAVRDGEVAIGFINEDLGATWESEGQPVKMIYAEDAVTVQMDASGLVADGPSPELGQLFIDFLGSQEIHEIAVDVINRRAARSDVEPPEELPQLGDLNLYPAAEPQEVVNSRFSDLID